MLTKLFTSRVRVRLLTLFLTHPAESFFVREISRLTGENFNNVRKELRNLAEVGLLLCERRANAMYYRANVEHFLFADLKRIVIKTEGMGNRLREALSPLSGIRVAFVYGSTAKGTELASSDIDLVAIGEVNQETLESTIDLIEEELGRPVNHTVFAPGEWGSRVAQRNAFVMDILDNPKVFLIGSENDLSELGSGGTA